MFYQYISSVKHSKGMTLIELFVLLTVLSVTLYVSYLVYKPQNTLAKLELVVSELQQITFGMRSYQTALGSWPSGTGMNCSDALAVLDQHESNAFMKGVTVNIFGYPYEFECNLDIVGSPMYISTKVPAQYLNYFKRYIYQVEIRNNENGIVELATKIPSVNSDVRTYLVSELYGKQVLLSGEDGTSSAKYADIAYNEAFVPKPIDCDADNVLEIGFFSNGLCPEISPTIDEEELQIYVNYKVEWGVWYLDYIAPVERRVVAKIFREFDLMKWHVDYDECQKKTATLDCRTNHDIDGWLVKPKPEFRVKYRVEYYEIGSNTPNGTPEYSDNSIYLNLNDMKNELFNERVLKHKFHPSDNPIFEYHVSDVNVENFESGTFFSYAKPIEAGFVPCNNYREKNVENARININMPINGFLSKIHGFVTCLAN